MVTLNCEAIGETPYICIVREMAGIPRIFNFVTIKVSSQASETVLKEFPPRDDGSVLEFPQSLYFDLKK